MQNVNINIGPAIKIVCDFPYNSTRENVTENIIEMLINAGCDINNQEPRIKLVIQKIENKKLLQEHEKLIEEHKKLMQENLELRLSPNPGDLYLAHKENFEKLQNKEPEILK
jgi:hypothetical protein